MVGDHSAPQLHHFRRRGVSAPSFPLTNKSARAYSHAPLFFAPPTHPATAEQGAHASNDWSEQRVEASGSIGTCAGHTSEAAVETYVGRGGVEPRAEPDKDDGRQEKKPVYLVLHRNLPCAPDKPLPRDPGQTVKTFRNNGIKFYIFKVN